MYKRLTQNWRTGRCRFRKAPRSHVKFIISTLNYLNKQIVKQNSDPLISNRAEVI